MILDSDGKSLGRIPTGPRSNHESQSNPQHFGRAWPGPPSRNVRRGTSRRGERDHYNGHDDGDYRNGGGSRHNRGKLYSDNLNDRIGMPDPSSEDYYRP